jgi:predicted tellurium resistance membrane protein TerC
VTWDWIVPLVTLSAMEIVLGVDNVIFIAILVGRLPKEQQPRARQLGLGLALVMRLGLLFTISWIMGLQASIFNLTDLGVPETWFHAEGSGQGFLAAEANGVSWRDLILLAGGLFLIGKSVYEIHDKLEGAAEKPTVKAAKQFGAILVQIIILDIVFSLDSVITAVGMAQQIWVMVVAMIIAVGVMLAFAGPISDFVHRHPTMKMLALSFLILIGVMLVADAVGTHIQRGYIYFAMTFALVVELLNLKLRARAAHPVELSEPPPVK